MLSRMFSHPRFLVFYSASVTVAFAVAAWLSFLAPVHGASKAAADFDRITVHRIDVVEPDGTPRLIISDRAEYPGSFFHRREIERPDRRDAAGMLFINDEGTEDGGLIYGGESKAGARSSFSHLSFDQYEQDQTVDLGTALYPNGDKAAGITLNDMPDRSITPELYNEAVRVKAMPHGAARGAASAALQKKYPSGTERASLSRSADGSVGLVLRDKEGRPRLQLSVANNGEPSIQLLDEKGQIKRSVAVNDSGRE
jgi:hypothetical protein